MAVYNQQAVASGAGLIYSDRNIRARLRQRAGHKGRRGGTWEGSSMRADRLDIGARRGRRPAVRLQGRRA
jgi:hypothetical protein